VPGRGYLFDLSVSIGTAETLSPVANVHGEVTETPPPLIIEGSTDRTKAMTLPQAVTTVTALAQPAPQGSVPRLSVVVLPFANFGHDRAQDFFADAITDDLTTDLSRLPGSFVIARNTAFTFRGKAVDAKRIGGELAVRYVVEGSVRREGGRVRVNVQLIDAETGAHVWADRFDNDQADPLEMQTEIIGRLARTLGFQLRGAEIRKGQRERPNNPDAVDLRMRGLAVLDALRTPENNVRARRIFEQALEIDNDEVDALLGLSFTHTTTCSTSGPLIPAHESGNWRLPTRR
jgi:adenylate cyclase